MYPDAVEKDFIERINSIPVYLLKIMYEVFPENEISGLVLREIGDGNFSRPGVFSLRHVFYLDDCGEEKYKRIQDWLDDLGFKSSQLFSTFVLVRLGLSACVIRGNIS